MKRLLYLTIIFIAIPSFFILTLIKEEIKKIYEPGVIVNSKSIKVKRYNTGTIEELNLEQYVMGVVAGEMPITFHKEALKAQAVAARTYALRRINPNNSYDVVDTVMNQVYLDESQMKKNWGSNYEKYRKLLLEVVSSTRGEYVDYKGNYADTLFFSTSTGTTENSEEVFGSTMPYLRSVDSMWDKETSPVFEETKTFSRKYFCEALGITYGLISYNITSKTSTGRVKRIEVNGKSFTGVQMINILNIRSDFFTISIKDDMVTITTRGFGHGVGMSQYGAYGMANNGYTYKEILEHYYQGTTIKNLNN